MKIVILAPVHIYDDIRVFRKEAVTLAAAGHEVVLYARTPDDQPLARAGVTVRAVPARSRPGRFAGLPALAIRALRERADAYHVHNPDTLPIGFLLRLLGRSVIYDTHEDFRTEILLRQWIPGPLRRAAAGAVVVLEAAAARFFTAVIVTQEQLLDRIPGAVLIGNPPLVDPDRAFRIARERAERARAEPGGELVLGYVGGLSQDRGLLRMLDLVAELQRHGPTRLLLIGPQVNDTALDVARARPEWQWVDYRGQLPQEEAFEALSGAHVGLILFEDTASHRYIDPNKIYEYLTLALPFVATGFRSWQERFAGAEVGLFLTPGQSVSESAGRVARFTGDRAGLAEIGRRGVQFVLNNYSWENDGARALLRIYRGLGRTTQSAQIDSEALLGFVRGS